MKRLILFFCLAIIFTSCAVVPKEVSLKPKSAKTLLFQISPTSGRLLVQGDPFKGNSATFWKMWPGKCSFHCGHQRVIVLGLIRSPDEKQVMYGTAVFIRAKDNFWYHAVFVPSDEIESFGGIVDITGDDNKINFVFKTTNREYPRLDK